VKDHTRELTFPAVAHLEREGFELERRGESVRLVA
jgi:hypothetical protein